MNIVLTLRKSGAETLVNLDNLLYTEPVDSGGVPIIGQPLPPPATKLVCTGGYSVIVKETIEQIKERTK